jgi:hypothetical protein
LQSYRICDDRLPSPLVVEKGADVIVVFVLCLAACFAAPLALVQRRPAAHGATRPPLDDVLDELEVRMVSALLLGEISRREYHKGMARIARDAAESGPAFVVNP